MTSSIPAADGPPGKDIRVYHIGNSLTRNIPVERLAQLFEAAGGKYDYGIQLGGGHQLQKHLSKRNHSNKPGEGKYNLKKPYGEYDQAFKNFKFDAVVLQPYRERLDEEPKVLSRWPWYTAGALQSASEFIDYARGETVPGDEGWHRQHPNTKNVATDRFYIYATFPSAKDILEAGTYRKVWDSQKYEEGLHCRAYFETLVDRLNERHPELPVPVRIVPLGDVFCELDERIREGRLPGIEPFYARNQAYFRKARRNNNRKSPFDPEEFQHEAGVLNFYADGVHLNDQPHNGADSGAIGSYVAALTFYATLTGESPVGLTTEPYEMFDPQQDAELIKALQETVWDVVRKHRLTGVSE
ncbi:hypothetical protein [Stratiformator vulcanicus]|uniref:hypothetical protein n=1 Tax=Stratiformator vulcanicus TaxID=2527980 RepID=UPI0011A904F5|nr:hypothetical protein [Stratiformator vulcanicus]